MSPSLTKDWESALPPTAVSPPLACFGWISRGGRAFPRQGGYYDFFYGQEGDYDLITREIGRRFEIVEVGPKPYPSCRYTHPAVTGILHLMCSTLSRRKIFTKSGFISARAICARGRLDRPGQEKEISAGRYCRRAVQHSLHVAATLMRGRLSLAEFTDSELRDQRSSTWRSASKQSCMNHWTTGHSM